jgi:ParB family chromosome partitioning protein
MSAPKKKSLGRGLGALTDFGRDEAEEAAGASQQELAVSALQPGRHQPRRHFDEQALQELAASITAQGVLQPIVVRPVGGEQYEIVAGERRWRAAQLAGLKTIPVVVRTLDERGAMAVALVENIQRADLNALEEAEALHKLIAECRLTHEQVAEAVGRSRAAVSNLLRMMELNPEVQQLLREDRISLGHAKVLLGVQGPRQSVLATQVADQQLSVRQTEALVKGGDVASRPAPRPRPVASELQTQLAARIGLPVRLKQNDKGRGQITIQFRSAAELDALMQRL